jgi:hypothetical protein
VSPALPSRKHPQDGDFADLDELARLLAERDHDGNIERIVAGATLAELRS